MMLQSGSLGCGCAELNGLYDFANYNPEKGEKAVGNEQARRALYNTLRTIGGRVTYGMLLFGDGVKLGNGEKFAQFLKDNNLGEVEASKVVASPLHPEKEHKGYQLWIWYVDHKAVSDWYSAAVNEFSPKPPKPVPVIDELAYARVVHRYVAS